MSFSSSKGAGAPTLACFTNCQTCVSGELIPQDLYFSPETGFITPNYYYRSEGVERIDMKGAIIAPGFLELQTNGMKGLHFAALGKRSREDDEKKLAEVARTEVFHGITAFWATVPTVEKSRWKEVRRISMLLCGQNHLS